MTAHTKTANSENLWVDSDDFLERNGVVIAQWATFGGTPERREFIVRACNSHDALVAALRDFLGVYCDACGIDIATAHPDTSAGRARAALALAAPK